MGTMSNKREIMFGVDERRRYERTRRGRPSPPLPICTNTARRDFRPFSSGVHAQICTSGQGKMENTFPPYLDRQGKKDPSFLGRENKKIVLLFISTDGRTAVFRWAVRTAPGLDIPPFLLWSTTVAPSPSFLFLLLLCVGPWGGGGGLTWAGQCGLWKCPPPLPS